MPSDIEDALRRFVSERAAYCCEYCLLHEEDAYTPHQIDRALHYKDRRRGT